VKAHFWWRK